MAIIRCPYCHAIIDENDKYCNNCGTQLLFTEDEEVEEEIPGEKIIEAEVEEKDYTVDEPEDGKPPAKAKDLDGEVDENLEEEIPEETEEVPLDALVSDEAEEEAVDDVAEEVILVDEIEAAETKSADGSRSLDEEKDAVELKKPEPEAQEEDEEDLTEELEKEIEKELEEEPGPRPVTFDTQELEDLGNTVELSKQKVDDLLEAMVEKQAETPPSPLEAPPPTPAPSKPPEPPTGTLPPWASTMKGAPVFPEDTGPVETRKFRGGEPDTPDTEEEVEIFPRRRPPDSTIGLPEKVSQAPLPFEAPATGPAEGEDLPPDDVVLPGGQAPPARQPILPIREPELEGPLRRGIEAAEEAVGPVPRPPFSFSVFFKSKAFDFLFVGLFWLVALWLAAYSMGMTLFDILGSMSGSMLMLYAVFVLLYFFLFKFFLGETLGDRLFRPRS